MSLLVSSNTAIEAASDPTYFNIGDISRVVSVKDHVNASPTGAGCFMLKLATGSVLFLPSGPIYVERTAQSYYSCVRMPSGFKLTLEVK